MFHGGIIYADLGRAPNKVAPAIPPQAAEPVVYSSVRQQNEVIIIIFKVDSLMIIIL